MVTHSEILHRVFRFVRLHAIWLACAIWLAVFGVMSLVLLSRGDAPASFAVYALAGRHWLQSQPLYDLNNIDGFQYFPTSAMLFAPFAALNATTAHVTWRALNWALYAFGIWRVARKLSRGRAGECFLLTTCLAVGSSTTTLVNGQANISLAVLILHACADLAERRWWRATALLGVGFALKPLMAVPLLLLAASYPRVRWRLLPVLCLAFGLPWLLRDGAYVTQQYADCLIKLQLCADPDRLFEDVRGLLATLGCTLSGSTYLTLRAGAALCVLGLAFWVRRRVMEPYTSFLIVSFAGSYLMLFNPRTQSSSYVMVVAPAAVLASVALLEGPRSRLRAYILIAIVVGWSIGHHLVACVEYWLRPLACIAFVIVLIAEIRRRSQLPRLARQSGSARERSKS